MAAITSFQTANGLEATGTDDLVEVRREGQPVAHVAFFGNGIFSVRETGRGLTGRLPPDLVGADLPSRLAHVLLAFRLH